MTDATDSRKRWDTDQRFAGVADASAFAAGVEELAELARRPGWITEEPEMHLVPHLRDANIDGLQLVDCQTADDGVLAVTATYDPGARRSDIRRRAWALLGDHRRARSQRARARRPPGRHFRGGDRHPRRLRPLRQPRSFAPAHPLADADAVAVRSTNSAPCT
jgi:hypothetical protein